MAPPRPSSRANQATGERYWATRGGGAWCDSVRLGPTACIDVHDAIIGMNGLPPHPLGYRQSRVLGAVALDLCHLDASMRRTPIAAATPELLAQLLAARSGMAAP